MDNEGKPFSIQRYASTVVQGASGAQTVRTTTARSVRWGPVEMPNASLVVLPDDVLTEIYLPQTLVPTEHVR